ncbi:tRNA (guanine-N(7)-)-methyltransferase non-catalytic subunit wdr4 isoform X2 [Syngnathus scovelli]|uniref:tRNA (guanine-N(7)-)-methyltransferase non-catalytic subunit wdr4 isoform X2 n=1 Tax=Syngnathus scovelli TaxID=161590 RepID=UPI00210FEE15|nr:tRNA (guanine-N(7)-)-methyltransferase non-catalytic subunit wdr4 isoform X4 [Syngnathus scovelli]
MANIGVCGKWIFLSCGTRLIAAHIKKDREPFVFDCSTAKKKENDPKACINSLGGPSGSDIIVSFVISPSGKLVALIDDSKRLVLFKNEHSWQWASTRWLVRRGTSLVFNRAEDEVLVADKSGDVYSFSVMQPEKEGELKMGHLSMILAVTVSLDDKYIITSDRDEKIRVSHRCSPYNIQSFCLGHKEFVSSLLVPSGDRHWLLSGSGKVIVCHITSSFDGCHIAVQFDRVATIQFFMLNQENNEKKFVPHSRLSLPHCPLDMTFDPNDRLWVLMDSCETLLQIFTLEQRSWKCQASTIELKRVTAIFKPHWQTLDASTRGVSRFEHLHKVTFDNITVYMEKKQQRLEEQQQKRKMEQKNKESRFVLTVCWAFSSDDLVNHSGVQPTDQDSPVKRVSLSICLGQGLVLRRKVGRNQK